MKDENDITLDTPQEGDKKSKLPFILTLVAIAVLATAAVIYVLHIVKEDPDVTITKLINESVESVSSEASNSYEGYVNSKAMGYVLDDLLLSQEDRVVAWDSINDCYVLCDESGVIYSPVENPSSGTDLWIYVTSIPESSKYSVYYCFTNKVTTQELIANSDPETYVNKNHYYSAHVYNVTSNGTSQTYTCTESDGACGYSYTVTIEK